MNKPSPVTLTSVDFLFGVPNAKKIPPQKFSEIAVVGRSNVGKSSLINRLLGRKTARVSSRPGCTLELNFFRIQGRHEEAEFNFTLVDLPGFGFAKVSKGERERISSSIVDYIHERKQLQAVLLLNDCRRPAGEDELIVRQMCADSGVPVIVVATKVDTLNQSERVKLLNSLAASFYLERSDLVLSGEKLSTKDLWERLLAFVEPIK